MSGRGRFALVAVAFGALLLLSSCGEKASTAGSDTSSQQATGSGGISNIPKTPDQKQAYRTVLVVSQAFEASAASGNAASQSANAACASMSAAMQRHMIVAAKATGGPSGALGCKAAMTYLIGRSPGGATQPSRVVGLKITGDTATATVRNANGETSQMPMVKEGGQWKAAAPAE